MIESMACGAPVIAFNHGSVTEVIEDGISGCVVQDEPAAVEALNRLKTLYRSKVRESFEREWLKNIPEFMKIC
jgi:glycosyltransferase involved in cell wall biosynthesis